MLVHLTSTIQIQSGRIGTKDNDGNYSHHSFAINHNSLELVVELSKLKTSPPLEIRLLRMLKVKKEV